MAKMTSSLAPHGDPSLKAKARSSLGGRPVKRSPPKGGPSRLLAQAAAVGGGHRTGKQTFSSPASKQTLLQRVGPRVGAETRPALHVGAVFDDRSASRRVAQHKVVGGEGAGAPNKSKAAGRVQPKAPAAGPSKLAAAAAVVDDADEEPGDGQSMEWVNEEPEGSTDDEAEAEVEEEEPVEKVSAGSSASSEDEDEDMGWGEEAVEEKEDEVTDDAKTTFAYDLLGNLLEHSSESAVEGRPDLGHDFKSVAADIQRVFNQTSEIAPHFAASLSKQQDSRQHVSKTLVKAVERILKQTRETQAKAEEHFRHLEELVQVEHQEKAALLKKITQLKAKADAELDTMLEEQASVKDALESDLVEAANDEREMRAVHKILALALTN